MRDEGTGEGISGAGLEIENTLLHGLGYQRAMRCSFTRISDLYDSDRGENGEAEKLTKKRREVGKNLARITWNRDRKGRREAHEVNGEAGRAGD